MVCFTSSIFIDFGKFIDVPARAIHLAFGMGLCFLAYPAIKSKRNSSINIFDFILAFISTLVTFYLVLEYEGLVYRQGILASLIFLDLKFLMKLIFWGFWNYSSVRGNCRAIGISLVAIALIISIIFNFWSKCQI